MGNPVPKGIGAISQELGSEEPHSKQIWWLILRWLLVGVASLTTFIGNQLIHLTIPTVEVVSLCIIAALFNLFLHFYFFIIKRRGAALSSRRYAWITFFQFAVDVLLVALLFHYTGGIASPLLIYLLFHVVLSGVLLERWACLLYATSIAITVICLCLLELWGPIPHVYSSQLVSQGMQSDPLFVVAALLLFIAALYISTGFLTLFIKRLREKIVLSLAAQLRLEQDNQELRLINQITKGIISSFGLNERLDFICQTIKDIMGLKGVAIGLLDERTNRLEVACARGLSEAYINKGPVDADKSLAKALEGEPHFVLDAATDPAVQYPEAARKEGIVSMLAFPLKGREKVIGTIRLYSDTKRYFSHYEQNLLWALSSQAAISIENAKIYDSLERQDKAKSEFIMLMTHELKAPLMAIQGLLEVMLKGYTGRLTEKQQELINRVNKRIDSVMEVSTGLLDIYEWQSRRPDVKSVPLSLKEQIQRAVEMFKASAERKGLVLTVSLPDEDLIVRGSEDEIEKILNNLITNAIKYTPEKGSIFLELSGSERQVILKVRDTGIGIAEEDLAHLFDQSFRTREAKEIDPYGKGLGLHFIKKVVETLGGTIGVESEKGKGTEFILAFPKA